MKTIIYIILYVVMITGITGCKKDTLPEILAPNVVTGEAQKSDKIGVDMILTGIVNKNIRSVSDDEIGFMVALSEEIIEANSDKIKYYQANKVSEDAFSCELQNLSPNTYYYCIYASSGYSNVKGKIKSFVIGTSLATLGKLEEISVGDDHASIKAAIIDNGGLAIVERGFCWSSSISEPTIENNDTVHANLSSEKDFNAKLTNLKYNTDYYVRAYAINEKGTNYTTGFIKIHTGSSEKPTVGTITVVNSTPNTIEVASTILNTGGAEVQERGFCYNTTGEPALDNTERKVLATSEGNSISTVIKDLAANTKYYICAYVLNKNGVSYSNVIMSSTKKDNPSIDDPTSPGNK